SLVLIAAVAYALVIRPLHLRGEQIGNLVQMRGYTYVLDAYRKAHGRYPTSLGLAIAEAEAPQPELIAELNRWGHKVLYQVADQRYPLVSYGRDGKPDGITRRYEPGTAGTRLPVGTLMPTTSSRIGENTERAASSSNAEHGAAPDNGGCAAVAGEL
ncbi:MAG TPA: hypothetical protein VGS00_05025, partial [Thermoanaerobaculia bacterium]|nr:hypothetical protein [Thermoanaerobaculia bacterium]